MYPSIAMSNNISQETKIATTLWISTCPFTLEEINNRFEVWQEAAARLSKTMNPTAQEKRNVSILKSAYETAVAANSDHIDTIFGKISSPDENSVDLCHDLFGLPDLSEMKNLWENQNGSQDSTGERSSQS